MPFKRTKNTHEIRAILLPDEDYIEPMMDQLVPEEPKPQVKWYKQLYKPWIFFNRKK